MYAVGKQYRVFLASDVEFLPCIPSPKAKEKVLRIEKNEFLTVVGDRLIGKYQYIEFCISGQSEKVIMLTEDCCNNCLMPIHIRKNK